MYGEQFATSASARSAEALELELRLEAGVALGERAERCAQERPVPGTPPVGPAAELVDAPHELGVEADPGVEAEAPPVHAAEPDAARPPLGDLQRRPRRVARQAERARQHARAPPGRKPSGTSERMPFSTSLYVPSPPKT